MKVLKHGANKNNMPVKHCRVCGHKLYNNPLLTYRNMPEIAQHLPDKHNLAKDKGTSLKVLQCSGCGLVQLDSSPVDYYKEVIRASGFSPEMKSFRTKQLTNFAKKYYLGGKKVIEIGCGRGEYLSIVESTGMKAHGLEFGKESVSQCRKNKLVVFRGFLEQKKSRIREAPFDAFFMFSFLEHLPDPNIILSGIHNNLADEAVGIVEVPNFDMIIEEGLFSEFMRDHLMYFTKSTLAYALESNGFEIISCQPVWHNYIISAIVKKRGKTDLAFFLDQQRKIKKQIESFIKQFEKKKVAVWGAGHQAFAVLSLLDLGKEIRYVVDSAPFKQGKFTPVSHISIVSPDRLGQDPIDGIIIMAGSYSDEIKKIINKRCKKKIKVAILRGSSLEY